MAPPEVPVFGDIDEDDIPDFTPIEFKIVGVEIKTRKRVEFSFAARRVIQLAAGVDLAGVTNEKGEAPLPAITAFLESCIMPDDLERWNATLHDPKYHFQITMLSDLCKWLDEKYSDRPTPPRSERRHGPRQTGRTSTAPRSRAASGGSARSR